MSNNNNNRPTKQNNQIQQANNKPALSEKRKMAGEGPIDPGFNLSIFSIDPELKKELDEQGLEPRFLSVQKLNQNGGYHPKGWRPYKRKDTALSESFFFGKDPDGYIRREDLVLGVKPKEEAEKHRAYLEYQAKLQGVKALKKRQASELKDILKQYGLGNDVSRVLEGYEED
jgi:hypothetical protein